MIDGVPEAITTKDRNGTVGQRHDDTTNMCVRGHPFAWKERNHHEIHQVIRNNSHINTGNQVETLPPTVGGEGAAR